MSTTKYRCVTCDHVFDVEEDDGGPGEARCPKCHRVHDVVPAGEPSEVPWFRRNATIGAAALGGVIGAAVLVYVLRMPSGAESDAGTKPTIPAASSDDVSVLLSRAPGVPGAELLSGKTAGAPEARARALGAVLRRLVETGALRVADPEDPLDLAEGEIVDPPQLLDRIAKGTAAASSLEIALLAVRIARAVGLAASLVAVERYGDARAPADPAGLLGHFAVRVDAGVAVTIDPALEGGVARGAVDARPVPDGEAGGILEAYRALREVVPRVGAEQPNLLAADGHMKKARELAADAPPVRVAATFLAMQQRDPGTAFAQAEALGSSGTPAQRVGAADLLARLGRVADAEKILAEVDTLYPGWARIPVVRAQIAFVRLGAMAMIDQARRRSDLPPDEQARMLEGQMRALGITENDRVEDQLAAVRRHLDEADGRGGGRSADRVREMYLLAQADLRMSGGDFGGAQQLLEDALKERPRLRGVAVTLAAILLARGEDARARAALEPVASAGAPVEKLAELAGEMAERIRPRLEATQGPNPFDLSAPPGTVPSTEPALTMPGLGGRRPGGLGEGLQLRF